MPEAAADGACHARLPCYQLPTIPEPTEAEIDTWHDKYLAALRSLYDAHKAEAMPHRPDAQLEIW